MAKSKLQTRTELPQAATQEDEPALSAAAPAPAPAERTLFQRVSDFLTTQDWRHQSDPQGGHFCFSLWLTTGSVDVVIDTEQTPDWARLVVLSMLPVRVPLPRRAAVAEALLRVNRRQVFGSFDLDFRDGEVRARTVLESDAAFSALMIERAVRHSLDLADQHYAAILAIAYGNAAPQDMLEMCSRGEKDALQ